MKDNASTTGFTGLHLWLIDLSKGKPLYVITVTKSMAKAASKAEAILQDSEREWFGLEIEGIRWEGTIDA